MPRTDLWTAEEVQALRENRVPEGRSLKSSRTKAFHLGLSFCPGGMPECGPRNLSEEVKQKIIEHVRKHRNRSMTARMFNVSRNYVYELCKDAGVDINPRPHDRLGEHIEFEGHNYSWKKGSWICTSSVVRASGEYNLTKILWKRYHGTYPDARHDVRYKDGNKYNLKKSNLFLVTKSEAQKLRMKDPMYKMNVIACSCFGLLNNAIMEQLDPEKKMARCRKAAATTRLLHPDRGRKAWETRRKRAEERGYYYTPETRRKMSEAHKGKPSNHNGKFKNEK